MDELIQKVMQSAGISEDQAQKSVNTVAEYLKGKMPRSFHPQIDNMLRGGKLSEGIREQLIESASEVKEKTEDALRDLANKTEKAINEMKEKLNEFLKKKD